NNPIPQNQPFDHRISSFLLATWLNQGSNRSARKIANRNAMQAVKTDSLRNCAIRNCFGEPTVLRMPTSFARFSDRAVLRFMKFMQATNSTNKPMTLNSRTYPMEPPPLPGYRIIPLLFKCQSLMG